MAEPTATIREFTGDPQYSLSPTEDVPVSPAEQLEAAARSALEDPVSVAVAAPERIVTPYGMSWQFDFSNRRFVREENSPVQAHGEHALEQWVQACLHTVAGAHPIFSRFFGVQDYSAIFGTANPEEMIADLDRRFRMALTQHDRIAAVDAMEITWDPGEGIVYIRKLDVVTDQANAVTTLPGITIDPAGGL